MANSLVIVALYALFACGAFTAASGAEEPKAKPGLFCQQYNKSPDTCKKVDHCAWCASKIPGVKPGCFKTKRALFLPKRVYECSKDATQLLANSCEGKSQTQCKKPECVWCVSAAVPSSCYTQDEAKRLPHAIFKCDTTFGFSRNKRQGQLGQHDDGPRKIKPNLA